jgi:hypothetical protein
VLTLGDKALTLEPLFKKQNIVVLLEIFHC